jgi:hypothetical protein
MTRIVATKDSQTALLASGSVQPLETELRHFIECAISK